MALLTFKDWRKQQKESSPQTRLMQGIARGNYPPTASPFTHSTPRPGELKANMKALKGPWKLKANKKALQEGKRKKGGSPKKGEIHTVHPISHFDGGLDQWVQAADNLEKSLQKLKAIRDKYKKDDKKLKDDKPNDDKKPDDKLKKPKDDKKPDRMDDKEDDTDDVEDEDTPNPRGKVDGRIDVKPKANR